MFELWYGIVVVLLGMYVILDGFDLGAGILSPFVARTDTERRQVLAAIGPFWDGNEVWLLAAGGALFVAFPRVLGAGLSGFYFAIILLLWCLVGRGIAIELRTGVTLLPSDLAELGTTDAVERRIREKLDETRSGNGTGQRP